MISRMFEDCKVLTTNQLQRKFAPIHKPCLLFKYSSETGLEARPISEADDKTKADNRQRKADVKKARTEDGQMVERIPKAEKRKIKLDKDDSRLIGVEESSTEELRRMDAQESMIVGDDERIVGDEERIAPEAATGQQEEVAEVPRIAPGVQFDSRNEDHRVSSIFGSQGFIFSRKIIPSPL